MVKNGHINGGCFTSYVKASAERLDVSGLGIRELRLQRVSHGGILHRMK